MLLKSFILVTYISAILADPSTTSIMNSITQHCVMSAGLSPDLASDEINSRMGCIFSCIMKSSGTMSDGGVYEAEKIIKNLPKDLPDSDKVISVLRTCAKLDTTECEAAVVLRDCLHSNLPCSDYWACYKDTEKYMYFNPILNPL